MLSRKQNSIPLTMNGILSRSQNQGPIDRIYLMSRKSLNATNFKLRRKSVSFDLQGHKIHQSLRLVDSKILMYHTFLQVHLCAFFRPSSKFLEFKDLRDTQYYNPITELLLSLSCLKPSDLDQPFLFLGIISENPYVVFSIPFILFVLLYKISVKYFALSNI